MARYSFLFASIAVASLFVTLQPQLHAQLPATTATVTSHFEADALGLANGASVSTWTATVGPDANDEAGGTTPTFQTGLSAISYLL